MSKRKPSSLLAVHNRTVDLQEDLDKLTKRVERLEARAAGKMCPSDPPPAEPQPPKCPKCGRDTFVSCDGSGRRICDSTYKECTVYYIDEYKPAPTLEQRMVEALRAEALKRYGRRGASLFPSDAAIICAEVARKEEGR